jgi:hypothetical protein
MVLTEDQQRRKEVHHQLALIRQVGSKTKEDATQNIKMVYDTVAEAKREVEAKVHEQVEKMMTEYYKCGALKIKMESFHMVFEGERKRAEKLLNTEMVKLQDLIQDATALVQRLAGLKRDFDAAGIGIDAAPMGPAVKKYPSAQVVYEHDGEKKPAAAVDLETNPNITSGGNVAVVVTPLKNPYAKKQKASVVNKEKEVGCAKATLGEDFDDEALAHAYEFHEEDEKDNQDKIDAANALLMQANATEAQY